MILRTFFLLILVLFVQGVGYSQNSRLKYAKELYENDAYYYAASAYEDVLERGIDSMLVVTEIADSYYRSDNLNKALEWYEFKKSRSNLNSEELTRLALLYRKSGNYNQSSTTIEELASLSDNLFVQEQMNREEEIETLLVDNKTFEIKELEINQPVSEIGVSYFDSTSVILARNKRNRFSSKQIFSWTGDYFYDLYKADIQENGQLGKTKKLKSNLKNKYHDGPACYSSTFQSFYFTRNNTKGRKKLVNEEGKTLLKIYMCSYDGSKIGEPQELNINGDGYSTAHPTISADGKYLIFASDRPGGFGGMDLYTVELDSKGLPKGDVTNLGAKVNTSRNEVFPYLNSKNNILLFSSDGLLGLGGLDIFCAELSGNTSVNTVQNLGTPINSQLDDFGFINNENQTNGYFCSNRLGGSGSDDIYYFDQFKTLGNRLFIEGLLVDQNTNEFIEGGYVYLFDHEGGKLDSTRSIAGGYYSFSVEKPQSTLRLIGNKIGYSSAENTLEIVKETNSYKNDLFLTPMTNYSFFGLIRDSKSNEILDDVRIILINNETSEVFDTITTFGGAEYKTDFISEVMGAGIDYTFKYSKSGYVSKSVNVNDVLDVRNKEIAVNGLLTPIVEGVTDLNDVVEIKPIYFDYGKYDIRPEAAQELDKVYHIMMDNPNLVIELRSHTDSRGTSSSNMLLSDRRAKSSANYLVSKGIPENRIKGKGFGESLLKVKDSEVNKASTTEEKERLHQLNRRTEFIIVKQRTHENGLGD